MGLSGAVDGLRKLGTLLASLFPSAAAWVDARFAALGDRLARSRLHARWEAFLATPRGQALSAFVREFYWSDHTTKRMSWAALDREGALLLRSALAVALVLAVALPFAMAWPWPAVFVEPDSAVAAWSVVLWLFALSFAWGLLLAAAGAANRLAFLVAAGLYLEQGLGSAVLELPRSIANVVPPLVAFLALSFSERRLALPASRAGQLGARAGAVLLGAASGAALVIPSPIGALLGPLMLPVGVVLGGAAGLVVFERAHTRPSSVTLASVVGILSLGTLLFFSSLAVRGGLEGAGRSLRPILDILVGYAWPLWYFAGAGVVVKVLSNTEVVDRLVRIALPGRVLAPAVVLFLVFGTLVLWAPYVAETPAFPWPAPITSAAEVLTRLATDAVWNDPARATAALVVRWVFALHLLAVPVLALERRLDSAGTAALFYQTLLGAFLVVEYIGQLFGFAAHGGGPSITAVFLFTVLLIWILQGVGRQLAFGASPRWPGASRLGLLAGGLVLLVLEVHVRGAMHDTRVMDEVFLYLFRGVVDVGLPYAAFVWVSRRLVRLPVSPTALFGAFAAGAALSLPLIALDHLAAAGWSTGALASGIDAKLAKLADGDGAALLGPGLAAPAWIAVRGIAAILALAGLGAAVERRTSVPEVRATTILAVAAAGAGLASAVRTRLELPFLSEWWLAVFTPEHQSRVLDANVLAGVFTWELPAILLVWVATRPLFRSRALGWLVGSAAGYLVHLVFALLWPNEEAWLRSTELLEIVLALGALALVASMHRARAAIDAEVGGGLAAVDRVGRPLPRALVVAAGAAACALLLVVLAARAGGGRMVTHEVAGLSRPLVLPAAWAPDPNTAARFLHPSASPIRAALMAVDLPAPDGEGALIHTRLEALQTSLRGFEPRKVDHEGPLIPGARALDFSFDTTTAPSFPLMGTVVFVPGPSGVRELTLIASVDDWMTLRWALPRIVAAGR